MLTSVTNKITRERLAPKQKQIVYFFFNKNIAHILCTSLLLLEVGYNAVYTGLRHLSLTGFLSPAVGTLPDGTGSLSFSVDQS